MTQSDQPEHETGTGTGDGETEDAGTQREGVGTETDSDRESDPALDDGSNSEWTDEGGATGSGPATDSPAAGTGS